MLINNKELIIARTRNELGPIYNKIKKISSDQIKNATAIRKQFFEFFKYNGIKFALNNLSKPYLNDISPGCWTCVNGTWSCIFMNRLCTRDCFFCLQDKQTKQPFLPVSEGIEFEHVDEYINLLQRFHFEGVGFSGGEPFLVFDKLIEYITKIREVCNSNYYIWIYTNGDLVTKEKLKLLREAGLNELRFDLSARKYDLTPLELAVKYIDTVTVEIPAIPEDLEIIKPCLKQFEKLNIKYLILHQLLLNKINYPEFIRRDYTLLHSGPLFYDILESEIAALEFLKYAIEMKTKIGINYCSSCYKQRFQTKAFRTRAALRCKDEFESITRTGYLRRLHFECSGSEVNPIVNCLKEKSIPFQVIKETRTNGNPHKIYLLPSNLKTLNENFRQSNKILKVIYNDCYNPRSFVDETQNTKNSRELKMRKIIRSEILLDQKIKFYILQNIIDGNDFNFILNELRFLHEKWGKINQFNMNEIRNFYSEFEYLEYLPTKLPDYF